MNLINEVKAWFNGLTKQKDATVQALYVKDANANLNGSYDVNIQDLDSPAFDVNFSRLLQDNISLVTTAVKGSYTFTVSSGHGIVQGNYVTISNTDLKRIYICKALAVVGDVITTDTPLNDNYVILNTTVRRFSIDMNVDGSITPVIFGITPTVDIAIDVTRVILAIISTNKASYNSFGDIAGGLTRGVVLRVVKADGTIVNYFNVKDHADLSNLSYDLQYYEESNPQGVNGIASRITYSGQEKHGVVIRLRQGDSLQLLIQDNLTTLVRFHASASGHVTIED